MKIAILDDYLDVALRLTDWQQLGSDADIQVFHKPFSDAQETVSALREFGVIVAMRERTGFPAEILEQLPELQLLVTTGMRNLSIDMDASKAQGITVCGTGMLGYPTAELTWALILALARNLTHESQSMQEGGWHRSLGLGLKGKTLGLYGLGKLGSQVAKVGQAFGMHVIAWSTNLSQDRCNELDVEYVSKEELFRQSDFLSIHMVLSDRTRSSVSEKELNWMKCDAFLINTSRGPIVNESELLEALCSDLIGGAAVDVFEIEPLPADHPFRNQKNLLLTGHIGYVTRENFTKAYQEALENIIAWKEGKPLRVLNAS